MASTLKYKISGWTLTPWSSTSSKEGEKGDAKLRDSYNDFYGYFYGLSKSEWEGNVTEIQLLIQEAVEQVNVDYAVDSIDLNSEGDGFDMEITLAPYSTTPAQCRFNFTAMVEDCIKKDTDLLNKKLY